MYLTLKFEIESKYVRKKLYSEVARIIIKLRTCTGQSKKSQKIHNFLRIIEKFFRFFSDFSRPRVRGAEILTLK